MDLRIEDRTLIGDLVVAYAYAIDEGDWAAFTALFTSDARIDYRSAGGIAGTPADLAGWMPQAMATFSWTLHSCTNHRIQFTGATTALGTLHMLARHGLIWEGDVELMDVSGLYHDQYVRTPAGWRFAARREETLSVTGGKYAELVSARLP